MPISRLIRALCGLLLLPLCVSATMALGSLIQAIRPESASAVPAPVWAFGGGFLLWVFLYLTMPRPVRSYVLAHELTHALWGALMGARVSRIRLRRDSGSVTLSKSNMWITLAPYFFPLYTVLVILGYGILSIFFDLSTYELFFVGAVGLTWAFHVTFTISTLLIRQSDIEEYGYLFSFAVIYLLNLFGLALWLVAVSAATLEEMAVAYRAHTVSVAVWLWEAGHDMISPFRQ